MDSLIVSSAGIQPAYEARRAFPIRRNLPCLYRKRNLGMKNRNPARRSFHWYRRILLKNLRRRNQFQNRNIPEDCRSHQYNIYLWSQYMWFRWHLPATHCRLHNNNEAQNNRPVRSSRHRCLPSVHRNPGQGIITFPDIFILGTIAVPVISVFILPDVLTVIGWRVRSEDRDCRYGKSDHAC